MPLPQPTLCRVEYWTDNGWFRAHHGMNFLDPDDYVKGLSAMGITARLTELDDELRPGRIHETELAGLL